MIRDKKNSRDKPILILIDGNALIHRSFHGLPPLKTKDGTLVNAVYGFTSSVFLAISEFKPTYIVVAFDVGRKTFRNEKYKEYKANREKMADELASQLPLVYKVVNALNIPEIGIKNYEADDVIGSITAKIQNSKFKDQNNNEKLKIIIVTGDMDTLQLVNQNTNVYSVSRGIKKAILFDPEKVKEKYGFDPKYLVDYKGLRGDPSDNIPGVPGVGEKTAINLIKIFGTIEKLYTYLDEKFQIPNSKLQINYKFKISKRIKQLLLDNKTQAFLSKELATIKCDVPFDFKLRDAKVHDYNKGKVEKLFRELEFRSLIKKMPEARQKIKQDKLF